MAPFPDDPSDPFPGPTGDGEPPPAALVRPYALTAGRTRAGVDLPLEAPVRTVADAPDAPWPADDVRADIIRLGDDGPSVAEIAARLALPLGVARVLIGDLVTAGYLQVESTLIGAASLRERRELVGRTLRGLRAL